MKTVLFGDNTLRTIRLSGTKLDLYNCCYQSRVGKQVCFVQEEFPSLEAEICHLQVPDSKGFPEREFFSIGFTLHRTIFEKVKNREERFFYICHCANQQYTVDALKASIARDDYHHQGSLPNNFLQTLPAAEQALRAVSTFKDEYLLDYIHVEELNIRDRQDVDERVIENAIIHNVKNFILTFGKDFAFIR